MVKSIIIDDNTKAIRVISNLLQMYCPDVLVTDACQNIQQAVLLINKNQPDVVFLDIELDGESGFDLFKYFPNPFFKVIFTTAHEKFAIKAIKSSCLDFILKPIDPEELINAVQKIKVANNKTNNFPVLLNNVKSSQKTINKIVIPTQTEFVFIETSEILFLEGEGKYTTVFTIQGEKIISSKNIGEFDDLLDSAFFFRCHKSYMVNLKHIKSFLKESSQILLSNDMLVNVSTRKKEDLLAIFTKI